MNVKSRRLLVINCFQYFSARSFKHLAALLKKILYHLFIIVIIVHGRNKKRHIPLINFIFTQTHMI